MENKQLAERRDTVRHNKLINARIKLNAKAYDLTRSFISLVERDDTDFWTYSISVADLGIDYKEAKAVIRNIMRNPVEICDDTKKKFEAYGWFTTMKYSKGVVEARINSDLKDMMVQLNGNHTRILEKYIFPMSSIYAKRLYELLSEYKGIGYRKFILDDLYDKLQVSKTLKIYSNFKNKVLAIAIEQINTHSDLYLDLPIDNMQSHEWIALQCGKTRGITHLNFSIIDNPINVDKLPLVMQWVSKVKKKYSNEKLMRYNQNGHNGYISVSSAMDKKKGRMYIQDLNGNSTGTNIDDKKSLIMWEFMYDNQDKLLIGNLDG